MTPVSIVKLRKKIMEPKRFEAWLKRYLRRASRFWPEKTKVYHRVKVDKAQYRCETCNGIFKQKEIQIDHIEPVVDLDGFEGWEIYISRLFCDSSNLQALCKPCHLIKTNIENAKRREIKKLKKKTLT